MYGGTTREDPEYPGTLRYPGTLSIPDTVSVRWYVWGDNSGGSRVPDTVSVRGMYGGTTREDPEYPGTLSIPDTVSVRWYVWGDSRDTYSGHCVCEVVCMGGQLGRIPSIPRY